MITNRFALALKELCDPRMQTSKRSHVLKFLEIEAKSLDVENTPMEFVASYIHKLYTYQSPQIRASLIMICGWLESVSKESILERYHFDKIVALSIEQRPPDPPVKEDEEKISAFFVVSMMLRMRHRVPKSILRAMVSLYHYPRHDFRNLLLNYFMETVVLTSSADEVPIIGKILIQSVLDPTCECVDSCVKVLCYGLENRIGFIHNTFLVCGMMDPLTGRLPSDTASMNAVCNAIVSVLQNWAGVFAFGLELNGFQSLLSCLRHSEACVIQILRRLLKLDAQGRSVLESYTGFVFFVLKQFGLLEKLKEIGSMQATRFLNDLMPFCSRDDPIDIPRYIPHKERDEELNGNERKIPGSDVDFDLLLMKVGDMPSSIIGYKLPPDHANWDWNVIYTFITVVLPNNGESESNDAKAFYQTLVNFFCGEFLAGKINSHDSYLISECLCSLVDMLLSGQWGLQVISEYIRLLKPAFKIAIHRLNKATFDEDNPHRDWAFFRIIAKIMSTAEGLNFLVKYDMNGILKTIGDDCKDMKVIEKMLGYLSFWPQPEWTITIFSKFLDMPDLEITNLAIEELCRKRMNTPNFESKIFQNFVIDQVKRMAQRQDYQRLQLILRVVTAYVRYSVKCQEIVAADVALRKILSEHGDSVFCQIFGSASALKYLDIQAEIRQWMDHGNENYVDTWDSAVARSFNAQWKGALDSMPSIILVNGVAQVPSHLFGELGKLPQGRTELVKCIPTLLERLKSNRVKTQRGAAFALAHLASIPEAEDIVSEYNIISEMLTSLGSGDSYTLRGTLISCMSLMSMSPRFAKVLEDAHWQRLNYGRYSCVVPSDPMALLRAPRDTPVVNKGKAVDVGGNEEFVKLLVELARPEEEARKKAKEELNMAKCDRKAEFLDPSMVLAASRLLEEIDYSPENREFIWRMFWGSPLMKPSDEAVDGESVAIVRALILEACLKSGDIDNTTVFTELTIPRYSLNELVSNARIAIMAAEVYISDEDLFKATGKTREEFYQLPTEAQDGLRYRLSTMGS